MTLSDNDLHEDRSGNEASKIYYLVNKVLLPSVGSLLWFDETYVCVYKLLY